MQYAKISNQFKYFCGGDIHSDKSYFKVLDQSDKVILKKNLPTNFALLKDFLNPLWVMLLSVLNLITTTEIRVKFRIIYIKSTF